MAASATGLTNVAANADRQNVEKCLINQLSTKKKEEKVFEKKDLLSHTAQTLLLLPLSDEVVRC